MKQLLKRLLNRIGLYTRGQTYAVLGQPFDQIQKTWKALSEAQRVQFAKHLYWHFRVNNEMISKLKRVDFDRLQFLLTHFSSSESRELLIALSDICFRSSNRTDTWPENLFAVLRRLVEISQMPAPRRDQILAQLSQVADIAQRWHAESSPWREEGLRLLASLSDMLDCLPKSFELWQKGWIRLLRTFIGLIKPNRASILAGFSKEPSSTLSPALSRALIDLQRNLPFQQALGRSRIRELYLVELFNGIEEVDIPLGAINELTGHANPADLLYVAAMARHRRARHILEIGTYLGRTSYHLTFAHPEALVTTVNLPPEEDPRYAPFIGNYFRGRERERQIRQVFCDSRKLDTTPYRAAMDFIFIDGDHSYEGVKADTAKAFEMLAPGGMIVWHDYAAKSPGVYHFAEEFSQLKPLFRVKKTCLLIYLDGIDVYGFQPHPNRDSLELKELGAAA